MQTLTNLLNQIFKIWIVKLKELKESWNDEPEGGRREVFPKGQGMSNYETMVHLLSVKIT